MISVIFNNVVIYARSFRPSLWARFHIHISHEYLPHVEYTGSVTQSLRLHQKNDATILRFYAASNKTRRTGEP